MFYCMFYFTCDRSFNPLKLAVWSVRYSTWVSNTDDSSWRMAKSQPTYSDDRLQFNRRGVETDL